MVLKCMIFCIMGGSNMGMSSYVMSILEDKFEEILEENEGMDYEEVNRLVMEWWETSFRWGGGK